jgi:hypothetical protein
MLDRQTGLALGLMLGRQALVNLAEQRIDFPILGRRMGSQRLFGRCGRLCWLSELVLQLVEQTHLILAIKGAG